MRKLFRSSRRKKKYTHTEGITSSESVAEENCAPLFRVQNQFIRILYKGNDLILLFSTRVGNRQCESNLCLSRKINGNMFVCSRQSRTTPCLWLDFILVSSCWHRYIDSMSLNRVHKNWTTHTIRSSQQQQQQ